MVREWQWLVYHLGGGMSFDDYLSLSFFESAAHQFELADMLERVGPKNAFR